MKIKPTVALNAVSDEVLNADNTESIDKIIN